MDDVLPIIAGTGIGCFPFPSRIVGHPSRLEGSQQEIVDSAVAMASRDGVAGLDLLAYRASLNVPALITTVCGAVSKPVIVAGSIDRLERIEAVRQAGAAAFTIGASALDGDFPAESAALNHQLQVITDAIA